MEKYKNHSEKIKKGQAKSDKKAGRPRKIDRNKIKETGKYMNNNKKQTHENNTCTNTSTQ